ncbi:unnamed protein product, partial [Lampetra fluviatilis]
MTSSRDDVIAHSGGRRRARGGLRVTSSACRELSRLDTETDHVVLCSLTDHELPPRAEDLSRHVACRSFVRQRAARRDRDRDRDRGGHLEDAGRKRLFCHLTQRYINQDQISQHQAGRRYRIALQRYSASVESGVPFTPLARRARGRGRGGRGRGRGGGGVTRANGEELQGEELQEEGEELEAEEEELKADSDSDLYPLPADLTESERVELAHIRRRKLNLQEEILRLRMEIEQVAREIDSIDSSENSKTLQRVKQMAIGRKKFNMDPKKGIVYLEECGLLLHTAPTVAQFLHGGEGLNKTAIGTYLGERDDFNLAVLKSFVELHEFTNLNLVQALRQFLWSFRLPGEAQKIDRMMEAFAARYCSCNAGVFVSTDTCYVLSFAVIMLNTSLHNPNVRDKPGVERFISMNRGINDGGDLPDELLRNLFDSIRNEPFKIPEDDGNDLTYTFFNPDHEGWLLKLGGTWKTWKRRWFILTDNCLYYFEYTT